MEVDHIDVLLERHLHLLHEYTTLREQLSSLQTGIYQNIARANFAAERGMRFGQDCYDERMQASRRVAITIPPTGNDGQQQQQDIPVFAITGGSKPAASEIPGEEGGRSIADDSGSGVVVGEEDDDTSNGGEGGKEKETLKPPQNQRQKDPLRWFGLLTPMPLRQAQAQSIQAVEQVVPRLASVNAQMAEVEIQVRRARKKRAKAEAAAVKLGREGDAGTEIAA
ncbi:uncharacterized protein F4812DRAFT_430893 [Daldinia caldariorum]|uniref:uncharacterized protein n=1 Tax=Daldinia caldariorum TaxID=326644 RepID=UPI002008D5C1|nr:uncharacterized protein F4812DRAFT_430893 [Daldinia caldariorum]KAI1467037.1 hypothetical protein F4812DRAFT_430893 [Daldinia caldariorum]